MDSPMTIIPGGAHGIGFSVARRLAADGGRLALIDDGDDALSSAAETLAADGAVEVLAVTAELTSGRAVADAFDAIADAWPSANALINVSSSASAEDTGDLVDERIWEGAFDSGLIGVVRGVRLALPLLRSARWGRIVTVLDAPVGVSASGSAVSAALMVFSKRLARRVREHDILVNVVSPAALLSGGEDDVVLATGSDPDEIFDVYTSLAARAGIPLSLRRTATAEEVADVVAQCASTHNRFMTGQHVTVDAMPDHISH
jgi:3-oxoacyl-[acyl-carrier protein] reductase